MDELANLVTHGFGFLLSLPAAALLMIRAVEQGRPELTLACAVYSVSLITLYGASTLSHLFYDLAWRRFFRSLDQACIYLLIAGSFTPFGVVLFSGGAWRFLLTLMWVLAIFGVLLVLRMRNLTPVAKATYGALGWLPVLAWNEIVAAAPFSLLVWIVAGGLAYSLGAAFLLFDHKVHYLHAAWHTFVIAGSICHYIAILSLLNLA